MGRYTDLANTLMGKFLVLWHLDQYISGLEREYATLRAHPLDCHARMTVEQLDAHDTDIDQRISIMADIRTTLEPLQETRAALAKEITTTGRDCLGKVTVWNCIGGITIATPVGKLVIYQETGSRGSILRVYREEGK